MAFRSAAYAVIARIFKLIDSNGFTRVLFGPFILEPGSQDGYAFDYSEPDWQDATTETGIFFNGTHSFGTDSAQTTLYAQNGASQNLRARVTTNITEPEDANAAIQVSNFQGFPFSVADVLLNCDGNEADVLIEAIANGFTAAINIEVDPLLGAFSHIDLTAGYFTYNGQSWTAYNPTVWQGAGTPNIAKVNVDCAYFRFGSWCFARGALGVNGPGTAGQIVNISLPPGLPLIGGGGSTMGAFEIDDASAAARYCGFGEITNTLSPLGSVACVADFTGFNAWGGNPAIALAAGDTMRWSFLYRCSG